MVAVPMNEITEVFGAYFPGLASLTFLRLCVPGCKATDHFLTLCVVSDQFWMCVQGMRALKFYVFFPQEFEVFELNVGFFPRM